MKFRNAQQVFKKYIPDYVPPQRPRGVWDKDSEIDCEELVGKLLQEFRGKIGL
jgi:hypothetical protein